MEVILNKEISKIEILDIQIKNNKYITKSDFILCQANLNSKNLLTIISTSKDNDKIKLEGKWSYFANVFNFNINGYKVDFEIEAIGKTNLRLKKKN